MPIKLYKEISLGKRDDLSNKEFGWLRVLYRTNYNNAQTVWMCICQCGNLRSVVGASLTAGRTKSCGCYHKLRVAKLKTTHGQAKQGAHTREYRTWQSIRDRCYNKNHKSYKNYGGRGITVCGRWLDSFENFYADMGEKPKGLTIERANNSKGYSPENCIWATTKDQNNNKRSNIIYEYENKKLNLAQWAEITGINRVTLWSRINESNWSIKRALTTPV